MSEVLIGARSCWASTAVTHLSHVAVGVPDPVSAASYYQRVIGLGQAGTDPRSGAILLSSLPPQSAVVSHHELVLYPSETVGVQHIGLAVPDIVALDELSESLRSRGASVQGPGRFEDFEGESIRVVDADGWTVEVGYERSPVRRPSGQPAFQISKLAHVTQRSPDPARQRDWWQSNLGFRLSDQIDDAFFFLRCNRDHHTLAFVRSEWAVNHHVAFELEDFTQLQRMSEHFVANGVSLEFGPGQHDPGDLIFVYFLDPWGMRWELFCDSWHIDDEAEYRPKIYRGGRLVTVNRWGGPPPPDSFM